MTGMNVESMYQEIILDHYKRPHHAGLRDPFDVAVHHVNPSCGDEVELRVRLSGGVDAAVVEDVSYDAVGCSISQAATSVMTDLVIGRPLSEATKVYETFLEMMHGQGRIEPDEDVLEDGIAFAGVAKFPARIKCALLGWSAWRDASSAALAEQAHDESTKPEGVSR
jgi:nitrogen fixation NifU-like protein